MMDPNLNNGLRVCEIFDLNWDCMWYIGQLLPMKSQLALYEADERFTEVIHDIWRKRFKDCFDIRTLDRDLNNHECFKILQILKPNVSSLTLENFEVWSFSDNIRKAEKVWNIEKLSLLAQKKRTVLEEFPHQMFNLSKLQHFQMRNCSFQQRADFERVLLSCPLKTFEWTEPDMEGAWSYVKTYKASNSNKNQFHQVVRKMNQRIATFGRKIQWTNLEIVKINFSYLLPDFLKGLLSLPNLSQLTIFTNLKHLYWNIGGFTNERIAYQILYNAVKTLTEKKREQIVEFNMQFEQFWPELMELFERLPNLAKIAWRSFLYIENLNAYIEWRAFDRRLLDGVLYLISRSSKLKDLDLRKNSHADQKFLQQVDDVCAHRLDDMPLNICHDNNTTSTDEAPSYDDLEYLEFHFSH